MAHVQSVSAPRMREEERQAYCGPMPAVTNPKSDFIQSVVEAIQNYRQEKRFGL